MIRQAAILCGGLGTRLGELTRATPKPLLPVGERPFLDILIQDVCRFGVRQILLLSAFQAGKMEAFAEALASRRSDLAVRVVTEPDQAGTGGALWHARDALDNAFFLLNGDSWFDVPLRALEVVLEAVPALGALSLRPMPASPRFGVVDLSDDIVTAFHPRGPSEGEVLVNGGIYALRRDILDLAGPVCSLEQDVLPKAAAAGRLRGAVYNGAFIDIGLPDDYARSQTELVQLRTRPALFVAGGNPERFAAAVRAANEAGGYVFLLGGKGDLLTSDIQIDDRRAAGSHEQDMVDLVADWPVDRSRSLCIGDDVGAAEAVGIATCRTDADIEEVVRRRFASDPVQDEDCTALS